VQAEQTPDKTSEAVMLGHALQLQRATYLAHPVPSADERRTDLLQLERFLQDNRQAIIEAISADFGHRSAHETLLIEITSSLAGIRQCRDHVSEWMRPQRRQLNAAMAIPQAVEPLREADFDRIVDNAFAEAHGTYGVPRYFARGDAFALLRRLLPVPAQPAMA